MFSSLNYKQLTVMCLSFFAVAVFMPMAAHAGAPIADVLCSLVAWLTGPVGGGIATLAVIIIGVGALMGKVSWGMAIIVALGIAIVFGAGELVTSLNGQSC